MATKKRILKVAGLIIVCLLVGCQANQQAGDTVVALDPDGLEILSGVELSTDAVYGRLSATNDYLVWMEMYENDVYVYDIDKRALVNIITIPRGQGPGEIEQLFSLTISELNEIYISGGPNQQRMLRVTNIDRDPMVNHIDLEAIPSLIGCCNGNAYSLNIQNPDIILNKINRENYEVEYINESIINVSSSFDNMILKSGEISCHRDELLYLPQFIPDIYVYDTNTDALSERKTYEDVGDMKGRGPFEGPDGAIIHLPPEEVDLRLHEAAGFPGEDHVLLLVLEGKGDRFGQFSTDRLYKYNWNTNEVVAYTELPAKASSVASNSNTVFVFSDEDYQIYRLSY